MVQTFVLNTCVMNKIKQLNRDSVFTQSSTMIHCIILLLYHLTFILTFGAFMETPTTEMS